MNPTIATRRNLVPALMLTALTALFLAAPEHTRPARPKSIARSTRR